MSTYNTNNSICNGMKDNSFVLIAEIGVNYYDIALKMGITPLDAAMLMIDEAKKAGIHAVKFQTYKAEKLASKFSPYYWDITEEPTKSQYELFKKFDHFGYNDYKALKEHCDLVGIEFLSTPFDIESVEYLNELINVYKISSSDLNNLPFIEYIAKKNKPILLSVGASNYNEIKTAVNTIRKNNNKPLVLMHCVLEYPTPFEHTNLLKISTLKEKFPNTFIGYSDHTKPTFSYDVIKTAYTLGAKIIEKHFTLDKSLKGNDHYHAMDPQDAVHILESVAFLDLIHGNKDLVCLSSEQTARKNARRSIVATKNIKQGIKITEDMLTFKRPGIGICPADIEKVAKMSAKIDIEEDTILTWDMLIQNKKELS